MRRRVLSISLPALLALFVLAGCDSLLPDLHHDTPTGNFEAMWQDFDGHYALFDVRGVDWDDVYSRYRPLVHDGMSDEELAAVLCEMLTELEDGHVHLIAEGMDYCDSNPRESRPFYPDGDMEDPTRDWLDQIRAIKNWYLEFDFARGAHYFGGAVDRDVPVGTVVGYLYLSVFNERADWDAIEETLRGMEEFDALVIDVRFNPGGHASNVERVFGLIADDARPYLNYDLRSGPAHDDFTGPYLEHMTRGLPGFRDKPIVVLNDPFTGSGGEWFTLGARLMPHVTVIGDTTRGVLSGRFNRILPNGWEYSSSGMLVRDMDGVCWEGLGVPPDIHSRNTRAANLEGRDLALDEAIRVLLDQLGLEP